MRMAKSIANVCIGICKNVTVSVFFISASGEKPNAKKLTGVQALQQMTSVNFLTNLRILANQLKNQKEFLTKWNIFTFQNKTPNEKPFERNLKRYSGSSAVRPSSGQYLSFRSSLMKLKSISSFIFLNR